MIKYSKTCDIISTIDGANSFNIRALDLLDHSKVHNSRC